MTGLFRSNEEYWGSSEVVAKYTRKPFLFRGERLAFDACFSDGLMGKRILDLGCGTGRTTFFLHKMGADVIGVDISRNLIQAGRKFAPYIDLREGDAKSIEFDDSSFDLVLFSFNGLDYIAPKVARIQAIREVWRVLRPAGHFIFSHHNLAGFLFGWHKFMKPWKLRFRVTNIINANVFKSECYINNPKDAGGLPFYCAWPKKVCSDLYQHGFRLQSMHSNSLTLSIIQRCLRVNFFTKLADPWPYYIFRKTMSRCKMPRE